MISKHCTVSHLRSRNTSIKYKIVSFRKTSMLNDTSASKSGSMNCCLVTNNIVLIKFLCHFIRFSLI